MVVKRGLSQSVLQIKTKYSGVLLFILYIYFLHLFILQAIYIVLQDLKMKMLFVE